MAVKRKGELHGLELGTDKCGDDQAKCEVGNNKDQCNDVGIQQAAAHGYLEKEMAEQQYQAGLYQANHHIWRNLGQHQLPCFHRCGNQHFQVAALAFADNGHGGEHDHGHGQYDADQARYSINR